MCKPPIHRHACGYVLLVTLLLMAVAGASLAVVSRRSLRSALSAKQTVVSLQRHWGAVTCQKALLPMAKRLLNQAEQEQREKLSSLRLSLTLGGQPFELIVADEQAKVNVNALVNRRGKRVAEDDVKSFIRKAGSGAMVKIKPLWDVSRPAGSNTTAPNATRADASTLPAIGSFAQVFPHASPDQLIESDEGRPSIASQVTCWGDGKVHFHRASQQVLATVCSGVLTVDEVDRLVSLRNESPDIELQQAIAQLALSSQKREQALGLLAQESSCYSLWVSARAGGRSWHRLAILESTQETEPQPTEPESLEPEPEEAGPTGLETAESEPARPERTYNIAW